MKDTNSASRNEKSNGRNPVNNKNFTSSNSNFSIAAKQLKNKTGNL
jgi:hypothetical protein